MNTPQNLLAHLRNAETNHIGFSYNINNGDSNPETGYMVSRKGYEQTAPQGCDLVAFGRNYFLLHAEQLADPTAYMGCWYNGGRFVFDISDNIAMMDNAIELGMRNDQEAIWDCASGSEYRLMREGDAEKTYTKDELYATMRSFIEDTRGDKPWVDADDEWFEQFDTQNTKGLFQGDADAYNENAIDSMLETLDVAMDELNQIYNHSASNDLREYYEMHMNQLDNIITLINKLK